MLRSRDGPRGQLFCRRVATRLHQVGVAGCDTAPRDQTVRRV
jgi:hypothetical protein